jgi:hypothetical protein
MLLPLLSLRLGMWNDPSIGRALVSLRQSVVAVRFVNGVSTMPQRQVSAGHARRGSCRVE